MERSVPVLASGLLRVARLRICLGIVMVMVASLHIDVRAAANQPLRPFWASRASLDSPESVRRAVASAAAGAFDAVMIPVALTADALPGFDGALEMAGEARARGLRVHAWIDVTLAAASGDLPASRDHVFYQHPEWLMVPRELAAEILKVDVRSPAYLGRLTRWVRANTPRVDGIYVSPLSSEAAAYLVTAVTAAAGRYAVDGVFLDAVRFPGSDFDYSRHAMETLRAEIRPQLTAGERLRLDKIEAIDPFAYAEEFPDRWRRFRQSRLTELLSRLRAALATVSPGIVVSAGIASDPRTALADSFQDWTTWMDAGLVDGIARRSGSSGLIVFTAAALFDASGASPASTGGTGTTR
jgi:uncharacterized lipoprotein YddW (UPF0748 family)